MFSEPLLFVLVIMLGDLHMLCHFILIVSLVIVVIDPIC